MIHRQISAIFLCIFLSISASAHCFGMQGAFYSVGTDYVKAVSADSCTYLYGSNGFIIGTKDFGDTWKNCTIPGAYLNIKGVAWSHGVLYSVDELDGAFRMDPKSGTWSKLSAVSAMLSGDSVISMFSDNVHGNVVIVARHKIVYYGSSMIPQMAPVPAITSIKAAVAIGSLFLVSDSLKTYRLDPSAQYSLVQWTNPEYLKCKSCLLPRAVFDSGDSLLVNYGYVWYRVSADMSSGKIIDYTRGVIGERNGVYRVLEGEYSSAADHSVFQSRAVREANDSFQYVDTVAQDDEYFIGDTQLNDIRWLSDSVVIVAGSKSTIFISRDGGWTWQLRSYNPYGVVQKMRDSLFGISNERIRVTRTCDGNVTWLPQKMTSDLSDYNWYTGGDVLYLGTDVVVMVDNTGTTATSHNYRYSFDSGATISYGNVKNWRSMYALNSMSLEKDSGRWCIYRSGEGYSSPPFEYWYTVRVSFDSLMQPVGYILFDSLKYRNIVRIDGALVTVATSFKKDTYDQIRIMRSSDNGRTWQTVSDTLSHQYSYPSAIAASSNHLFVPTFTYDTDSVSVSLISWYDTSNWMKSGTCIKLKPAADPIIVEWQRSLYFGGRRRMLAHKVGSTDPMEWDTVSPLGPLFYGCLSVQGSSMILYVAKLDSNNRTYSRRYGVMRLEEQSVGVDNLHIENKTSMLVGDPYPTPCRSICRVYYSHDDQEEVTNTNISVYDVNGYLVDPSLYNLSVANQSMSKAELTFEISNFTKGVYILRVQSRSGTQCTKLLKCE